MDSNRTGGVLAGLVHEEELAAELRKTKRTLRRMHSKRKGPRRTVIGRTIYYARHDIEQWLESLREDTAHRGAA
jgi:predicted DNA-binding transcriptional regulator AlpA